MHSSNCSVMNERQSNRRTKLDETGKLHKEVGKEEFTSRDVARAYF